MSVSTLTRESKAPAPRKTPATVKAIGAAYVDALDDAARDAASADLVWLAAQCQTLADTPTANIAAIVSDIASRFGTGREEEFTRAAGTFRTASENARTAVNETVRALAARIDAPRRDASRVSQRDVARALGVSEGRISQAMVDARKARLRKSLAMVGFECDDETLAAHARTAETTTAAMVDIAGGTFTFGAPKDAAATARKQRATKLDALTKSAERVRKSCQGVVWSAEDADAIAHVRAILTDALKALEAPATVDLTVE